MTQFLGNLLAGALVNNLVLVQLVGLSAFFAYTNTFRNAVELAWISSAIMFGSALINLLLARWILLPLNLEQLQLLLFLGVSTLLTHLLIALLEKRMPTSLRRLGLEFYLISGNSAIVALSLQNHASIRSLSESITYSFGSALGFALVLVLFAALRERLETAAVPDPFRGAPIQLISAGIVAMCLLGFAGVA